VFLIPFLPAIVLLKLEARYHKQALAIYQAASAAPAAAAATAAPAPPAPAPEPAAPEPAEPEAPVAEEA
jgi:hypothetical protein